ncbi:MAG: type I 3-dehydroquinate dehydratase [Candidatus Micrarchaeota archaeon]
MLCVSIGEKRAEGCIAAMRGAELAEVRIDMLEKPAAGDVRAIFSSHKNLIATCRPGALPDQKRKELLIAALEAGAAYVDIEVESADEYKGEIAKKAKAMGRRVIVSYHDYERTPTREELLHILEWCFDSGADIAKIACMPRNDADNARLLGLLDGGKSVVVIGMGERGKITRILAPLLGSPFTYVSTGRGKETAGGQIDMEAARKAMDAVREAVQ